MNERANKQINTQQQKKTYEPASERKKNNNKRNSNVQINISTHAHTLTRAFVRGRAAATAHRSLVAKVKDMRRREKNTTTTTTTTFSIFNAIV